IGLDREGLDVTDPRAVKLRISAESPDAVVQGAAYTDVDAAEFYPERAEAVNVAAAENVARACYRMGALFVYPSSDYVFSGDETRPYRPTDSTGPINSYGRSKLAGESAAREAGRWMVIRTSWLYGAGGNHFVGKITRLAGEREGLEVVDDQIGRPTWTGSLATTTAQLMECGAEGILHASDGGEAVSWCGFAREILARQGLNTRLVPVPAAKFPSPAARPRYSVLDCSETEQRIGREMPEWPEMLGEYLNEDFHGV
ncbi:MAG: dTDP-4-dehydrorhamnose reductase, partial [Gemmatimonadota bacterium]|nr:dTDP-4-dehydrorhamnose reductase [Gemmatimonadota bacterium]